MGQAYAGPKAFGLWFKRLCVAAGLLHCAAHGLRKAGATIAAENGATEHQLMAIYGWDSPKQAALYAKAADRKWPIKDAMPLVDADHKSNESVPPDGALATGGTIRGQKS